MSNSLASTAVISQIPVSHYDGHMQVGVALHKPCVAIPIQAGYQSCAIDMSAVQACSEVSQDITWLQLSYRATAI
jgi:hypothetical protein